MLNTMSHITVSPRSSLLARTKSLIEYGLLCGVGFFLAKCLPKKHAVALARWFTATVGVRLGVHQRAVRQLNAIFPTYSATQIRTLATGVWQNLGHTAVDFVCAMHGHAPLWRLEGAEHLPHLHNGALLVSAHAAYWEAIRAAVQAQGLPPVGLYYRRFNNQYLDKRIQSHVQAQGAMVFHKGIVGTRALLKALKTGQSVLLLADQRMTDAPPLPFMGHNAPTSVVPAQMALRAGVPLVPALVHREGLVSVVRLYAPLQGNDPHAIMQQFNDLLGQHVRQYPAQWLWLHTRWGKKSFQPKEHI